MSQKKAKKPPARKPRATNSRQTKPRPKPNGAGSDVTLTAAQTAEVLSLERAINVIHVEIAQVAIREEAMRQQCSTLKNQRLSAITRLGMRQTDLSEAIQRIGLDADIAIAEGTKTSWKPGVAKEVRFSS